MGRNQIGDIEAGNLKTTNPALSNDVNFSFHCDGGSATLINIKPRPNGRSAHAWILPLVRVGHLRCRQGRLIDAFAIVRANSLMSVGIDHEQRRLSFKVRPVAVPRCSSNWS
jgi:hypothetical protein